ncbi:MAG: hypothetical protein CVT62_13305 [Actinobacteria bacterium HGW-Actinobacteria-2]|nr:MAG: hypothetical protein CVT62_13305 [Actinobacteria bacterium HGW-Actinobacteria-2]
MVWVLVGVTAAVLSVLAAMGVGLVDELRRPPSNVRRMGTGLALVAGFAGIWLLVTPITAADGVGCAAPVLVLAEYGTPPVLVADGCSDPMRLNAVFGLVCAGLSPVAVLATRSRRD